MNKRAAILTLLNVTAMADGKVTPEEKQMIYDVLEKEFDLTEEEVTRGLEENTRLLQQNTTKMVKEAVLVLRNECTVNEMKKIIKLVKDMTMADNELDRREILIVELLTMLTA
ncbi:MAG: TerB family tellurite resistance protein [candidate division KSB1 bacterium]|nr:TerB family tellurite resistance protein [candidate division KSB1 bacterium]